MSHWPPSAIQRVTTHRELLNNTLTVCEYKAERLCLGEWLRWLTHAWHVCCIFKSQTPQPVSFHCSSHLHRIAVNWKCFSIYLCLWVVRERGWMRSSRMSLCQGQHTEWSQRVLWQTPTREERGRSVLSDLHLLIYALYHKASSRRKADQDTSAHNLWHFSLFISHLKCRRARLEPGVLQLCGKNVKILRSQVFSPQFITSLRLIVKCPT